MKEGQDKIYYVTAETFNAARNSPHLEIFRKKGIEVLLLSDRVDEWVVGHLTEFDKKPLVSVAKGGLDLGALEDEAERKADEADATALGDLIERVKKSLGDRVKDVRTTRRLTDSPACLVADEHDVSGNLARMLKAAGQHAPEAKPILEINPKHPVIERLVGEHAALRRVGAGALRPGAARRRRAARRPGDVRQADQRADARNGGAGRASTRTVARLTAPDFSPASGSRGVASTSS